MDAKKWGAVVVVACLVGVAVVLVANPFPFSSGVSLLVMVSIIIGVSAWTALQRKGARGARNLGKSMREKRT